MNPLPHERFPRGPWTLQQILNGGCWGCCLCMLVPLCLCILFHWRTLPLVIDIWYTSMYLESEPNLKICLCWFYVNSTFTMSKLVKWLVKTHRKLEAMLNSDVKELPPESSNVIVGGFHHKWYKKSMESLPLQLYNNTCVLERIMIQSDWWYLVFSFRNVASILPR